MQKRLGHVDVNASRREASDWLHTRLCSTDAPILSPPLVETLNDDETLCSIRIRTKRAYLPHVTFVVCDMTTHTSQVWQETCANDAIDEVEAFASGVLADLAAFFA